MCLGVCHYSCTWHFLEPSDFRLSHLDGRVPGLGQSQWCLLIRRSQHGVRSGKPQGSGPAVVLERLGIPELVPAWEGWDWLLDNVRAIIVTVTVDLNKLLRMLVQKIDVERWADGPLRRLPVVGVIAAAVHFYGAYSIGCAPSRNRKALPGGLVDDLRVGPMETAVVPVLVRRPVAAEHPRLAVENTARAKAV